MGSFKVSLTALMIIMRWEVGGGVHNRLKASGILTTPWLDNVMPYLSFARVIILYQNMGMVLFRVQKWMSRTWKYWMRFKTYITLTPFKIRQPFLSDVNWSYAGAVRLESEMQVNPGQLSDYPACPTIPPVRLSDRTVRQDSAFLELAIWVERD